MLTKLSEILNKFAKGWIILIFLILTGFFNAVILSQVGAKLQELSGGTGPIDLQFFYTPEKAYSMIQSYGEQGRGLYRIVELTIDVVYPIVYTLFFSLTITWLFQYGFAKHSKMQKLNLVPFAAMLSDLLENLSIVTMISIVPNQPPILAWAATCFTSLKWTLAGVGALLVIIGIVVCIIKLVRTKKQK